MTIVATKLNATEAATQYRSIVDGEGFRFASLKGVAPIDLVGENPRMVMIQRTNAKPATPVVAQHAAPVFAAFAPV